MRLADCHILGRLLRRGGQVEEILVKRHADGKLSTGFGLEASDRRVAQRFVRFPIAADDGHEEPLVEIQELLRKIRCHESPFKFGRRCRTSYRTGSSRPRHAAQTESTASMMDPSQEIAYLPRPRLRPT